MSEDIYLPLTFYALRKGAVTRDGHTMFDEDIVKHLNDYRRGFLTQKRRIDELESQLEVAKEEIEYLGYEIIEAKG